VVQRRKAASGTALFEAAVPFLIDASPQHLDEIAARGLRINIATVNVRFDVHSPMASHDHSTRRLLRLESSPYATRRSVR
jgi:hypothetical protein